MSEGKKDTTRSPSEHEGWLMPFARWFQPYGILIAISALVVAFATLWIEIDLRSRTLITLKEERDLRNKTLAALKGEKELREASFLSMLLERLEVAHAEKTPYAGHVPIFERLARAGMDLSDIDVTSVDFSVDGGISLNDVNLTHVDFAGSDLSKAQLASTNLTQARFQRATLFGANLAGAVLERAILKEANVSEVNFKDATGLRQKMLDTACANPEQPPANLPKDSRTGKQLVWRGQACKE